MLLTLRGKQNRWSGNANILPKRKGRQRIPKIHVGMGVSKNDLENLPHFEIKGILERKQLGKNLSNSFYSVVGDIEPQKS